MTSAAMSTTAPSIPYRLIYELGNAFAGQLELDPLLKLVTQKCREVLDAEGAAILLLDPERNELYFPYLAELDPEVARRLAEMRFSASQGIAGEALRTGRVLKVADTAHDERFYSLVDRHTGLTTKSILAAPLIVNSGGIGVVEVVNSRRGAGFNDDDSALLELLANSIALAIRNTSRIGQLHATAQTLRTQVGVLRRDLARHELTNDIVGASSEMSEVLRLVRASAHRKSRFDSGRNRDRQRTACTRSPSDERSGVTAPFSQSTAPRSRSTCWRASCLVIAAAPTARSAINRAFQVGIGRRHLPHEIGEMPLRCSPNFCGCWDGGSFRLEARVRNASTRVTLRPTATFSRDLRRHLPLGYLLSPRGISDRAASSARAQRRHRPARRTASWHLHRSAKLFAEWILKRWPRREVFLAGQRP